MLGLSHLVRFFLAASRGRASAALFLGALVAVTAADALAPRPFYAWYWHAAAIGYVGLAGALKLGHGRTGG